MTWWHRFAFILGRIRAQRAGIIPNTNNMAKFPVESALLAELQWQQQHGELDGLADPSYKGQRLVAEG
jgi:hypothetical protein